MNKNDLIDDINSGMSKYSVFLVVITFAYSYFARPFGPSLIEGVIFILLGVLLIPPIIGLPLNFLKRLNGYGAKSILLESVLDKIGLFLVMFFTQWVYIYLFNN